VPVNGFKSVTISEEAYEQAKQLVKFGVEKSIGKAFANAIKEYMEDKEEMIEEMLSVKAKWSKRLESKKIEFIAEEDRPVDDNTG